MSEWKKNAKKNVLKMFTHFPSKNGHKFRVFSIKPTVAPHGAVLAKNSNSAHDRQHPHASIQPKISKIHQPIRPLEPPKNCPTISGTTTAGKVPLLHKYEHQGFAPRAIGGKNFVKIPWAVVEKNESKNSCPSYNIWQTNGQTFSKHSFGARDFRFALLFYNIYININSLKKKYQSKNPIKKEISKQKSKKKYQSKNPN